MKSISSGRARYVGIELAPASGEPDIAGECLHGGTLEIVAGDRMLESFRVAPGSLLQVADGAAVSPGQPLIIHSWSRNLRANLPTGVEARVHLPDARHIEDHMDDVTGLSRRLIRPVDGLERVWLELKDGDGRVRSSVALEADMTLVANEGDVVRCGAVLARFSIDSRETSSLEGLASLRRFLDAKTPNRLVAASAPIDGEIDRVERGAVTLRGRDDRRVRIRVRRGRRGLRPRDQIRSGDPLDDCGDRSHHRLLRAWGETRLAEHMLRELDLESRLRHMNIPRVYWSLAVRAMLQWRRVVSPGGSGLRRNQVLTVDAIAIVQEETLARGGVAATVVPVLRGLAAMARERVN